MVPMFFIKEFLFFSYQLCNHFLTVPSSLHLTVFGHDFCIKCPSESIIWTCIHFNSLVSSRLRHRLVLRSFGLTMLHFCFPAPKIYLHRSARTTTNIQHHASCGAVCSMYKEKCQSKLIENSLNLVYLSEAYNINLCKVSVSVSVCDCICVWAFVCVLISSGFDAVIMLCRCYCGTKVFAVELTR